MIITIYTKINNLINNLFNKSESQIINESVVKPYIYFLAVIIFYTLFLIIKQPNWVLSGEIWAEMATNYFVNAESNSIYQKLFATDAGYIPIPQRLIALFINILSLPASSVPYAYTWSAIIVTSMMIGSFVLPVFRQIVKSDLLRLLAVISILLVADFETRTFINFTYFVAFFAAIVTALALVQHKNDKVPLWSWFLPFLIVSKPAVMAVLPAMIIVSFFTSLRFRLIVLITFLFIIAQILQMSFSLDSGMMQHAQTELGLLSKLYATIKYFFGFMGGYFFGPSNILSVKSYILFGVLLFLIIFFTILKIRKKSNALVLVGMSLIFFNILLNCFALSSSWNANMQVLSSIPLYRHIIVAYFGMILIVIGLLSTYSQIKFVRSIPIGSFIVLFLYSIWFVFTGWFQRGLLISNEPQSPTINNSHWQQLSGLIDSKKETICIPINPIQWVYKKNCTVINQGLEWKSLPFHKIHESINFELPKIQEDQIHNLNLHSISILVKPAFIKKTFIEAEISITTNENKIVKLYASNLILPTGGTLFFSTEEPFRITNIENIKINFNIPVEIAMNNSIPAIMWLGNK